MPLSRAEQKEALKLKISLAKEERLKKAEKILREADEFENRIKALNEQKSSEA